MSTDGERAPPALVLASFKRVGYEGALATLKTLDDVGQQLPDYARKYSPPRVQTSGKQRQQQRTRSNARRTPSAKRRPKRSELTADAKLDDIIAFRQSLVPPVTILGILAQGNSADSSARSSTPTNTLKEPQNNASEPLQNAIPDPFHVMCDDVTYTLGAFETAMQEFAQWKNEFLNQNVTNSVKLNLALMTSQVIRRTPFSQSDLSQMVMEMLRTVKLYSSQWLKKYGVIIEMEEEHARQARAFDIVLRKMEAMQQQMLRQKTNRIVFLWEFLTKKMIRRREQTLILDMMNESDEEEFMVESKARSSNPSIGQKPGTLQTGDQTDGKERHITGQMIQERLDQKKKDREKHFLTKPTRRQVAEQRFNHLLSVHHPNLSQIIYSYLSNPSHSAMYYASEVLSLAEYCRKESTESTTIKAFNKRSAWTTEDAMVLCRPQGLRGLVRSNSFCAVDNMQYRLLVNSDFSIIREQELMQQASESLIRAAKSRTPPKEDRFDEVMMVLKQPTITQSSSNLALDNIDLDKTWFTLQDVVELSMLHMQKVRQLQLQYDEKVEQLTSMNIQYQVLPDRMNTHDRKPHSPLKSDSKGFSNHRTSTYGDDNSLEGNDIDDDNIDNSHNHKDRKNSGNRLSLPAIHPGNDLTSKRKNKKNKNATSPHTKNKTKYVFDRANTPLQYNLDSSLLKLNVCIISPNDLYIFVNRLYRFDKERREKIAEYSKRITREAFEANLMKVVLDHGKVYTQEEVLSLMQQVLPAEFMPSPKSGVNRMAFPARPVSRVLDRLKSRSVDTNKTSITNFDIFGLAQPLKPISHTSMPSNSRPQS